MLLSQRSFLLDLLQGCVFFDAEACFNRVVTKSSSTNLGGRVLLPQLRLVRLPLEVHNKDADLLHKIQSFFGGIVIISFHSKKTSYTFSSAAPTSIE